MNFAERQVGSVVVIVVVVGVGCWCLGFGGWGRSRWWGIGGVGRRGSRIRRGGYRCRRFRGRSRPGGRCWLGLRGRIGCGRGSRWKFQSAGACWGR